MSSRARWWSRYLAVPLFRPAIEEHQQNYDWRGPYNRFVEGLRDSVLAWLDADTDAALDLCRKPFGFRR